MSRQSIFQIFIAMENPTKLVVVKEDHSYLEIKHEEACFELIEENNFKDDVEEKKDNYLIYNEIKTENDEFSEHEDFEVTGPSEVIEFVKDEEEMICDWNVPAVNEPDPLALFPLTQNVKVEPKNEEEKTAIMCASPSTSKEYDGILEGKTHKCSLCNYSSSRKIDVKRHQTLHTAEKPYKCVECNKSFSRSAYLKYHQRVHTGVKPYKCGVCNQSFSISSHLKRHQRLNTGEKSYKCVECNLPFCKSSHLKRHQRLHTGEKLYKCVECNLSFSMSSHLKIHQRLHTGVKPFKCLNCNYTGTRKSDLKSHLNVHTGEKPYKCLMCNRQFTRSRYLKGHCSLKHNGEKLLKCTMCNYTTPLYYVLQNHLRIHTGKKN